MPVQNIPLDKFREMARSTPVLDVRSPAEYHHAHIPGAISFPLFTDEQRKEIGTVYKQVSQQEAVKVGLKYFGPELIHHIGRAEKISAAHGNEKRLLVHCWRGGMRSAGMAWLLDLYGFEVYTLKGGYKTYRRHCIGLFEKHWRFNVLGGYTGSGKTEILEALRNLGEPVIDLEALASHKGSAFGALGQPVQDSQEMFENKLAEALLPLAESEQPVWIEDESIRLGQVNLPHLFFKQLIAQPLYFIEIPFEERLKFILQQYGRFEVNDLVSGVNRIRKRLGGLDTRDSLQYLESGNLEAAFRILLRYYDKQYHLALEKQERTIFKRIEAGGVDHESNAQACLRTVQTTNSN